MPNLIILHEAPITYKADKARFGGMWYSLTWTLRRPYMVPEIYPLCCKVLWNRGWDIHMSCGQPPCWMMMSLGVILANIYIYIIYIYIRNVYIYIYTYNIIYIYIYMWEYHSPWTGNSYKVRAPGTSSFLNLLISSLYSPWTKTWSRLYAVTSPFRFQGPQLVGTVYMLYNPSLSWWNLYNGFIIIDLWDIHI